MKNRTTEVYDYIRLLANQANLSRSDVAGIFLLIAESQGTTVESICQKLWDTNKAIREYNGEENYVQ